MEEQFIASQRPAWATAVQLIAVGFLGFVIVGSLIGFLVAIPFMEGSVLSFIHKLSDPVNNPEIKLPLLVMQSCVTFVGLAAFPALYWYGSEKKNPFHLLKNNGTPVYLFVIAGLIVVSFMPVDSVFIEWNEKIKFPDFLGGFDEWARDAEKKNQALMSLFTTFDSFGQFLFTLFTISILAGFSEEFFFRGMLQPVLRTATGNIHVAIWLTAILFSAIHTEFFGFVPRMFLGALFGYLYFWSGNLWLAITGHMVNNGLSVIALYVDQKQKLNLDLENAEALPIAVVIGGGVVFCLLMYYFYRTYKPLNDAPA